jgi:hypothetical protein
MSVLVILEADRTGFAEDKQMARRHRVEEILPTLARGEAVVLDFSQVTYATQSFVHALIGEALQKHGEEVLTLLEFKNCTPPLRSLVELVVDYSLSGFAQAVG